MSKPKPLTVLQRSWLALLEIEEAYRCAALAGHHLIVTKNWFRRIVPLRWQSYHQNALDELVQNGWLKKDGRFYSLTEAARVNLADNYKRSAEFAWCVTSEVTR